MNVIKCAKEICEVLRDAGYISLFAGGWVRDTLLGTPSDDIDIATSATPEEIAAIFPDHVLVGAQFGVVIVLFKNFEFEVATFRQDLHYTNGRSPTSVQLEKNPEEDAKRRDFTINGMFFDPITEQVYDFVGGKLDLEKKLIRTIGDANERFMEDRLRMLRAVRFAFRFGFTIEEKTRKAIQEHSHSLLPAVSMERIWQEFCKMRNGKNFKEALLELFRLGLLTTIFPQLSNCKEEEIKKRLTGIETLSSSVPTLLFLASLFPGQKETRLSLQEYLKTSRDEGKWVETLLELEEKELSELSDYEIAKRLANPRFTVVFEALLSKCTPEQQEQARLFEKQKRLELSFFIDLMQKKELLVKACDLQAIGILPGKKMGLLLHEAEKIAVNSRLTSKEAILHHLQHSPLW